MRKGETDKIFGGIVIILVLAGFLILTSASMGLLSRSEGSFYKSLLQQFLFGIVGGIIALLITSHIDYKKWKKFALLFFIFTFLLTLLVFVPGIGIKHGGATRWINIGSFSFHPSELLKLGFVIYLASWMASRKEKIKSFRFGFLPFLIMIGFAGGIMVMQPDLGTLGVLALTSMTMFFLGGGKLAQIALIIFLGALLIGILIFLEPYRMNRVMVFLNPSLDPTGIGYQLKQSLIAIGSGGIFGRGFGMSIQKFNYLPEPIGDSIFAVFAEEFGFIGIIALLGLFMFFLYRGFSISLKAPDDFGRLLGSGIVILIIVESFVNIGAMTGILPLTGVPLIFVSKGGSALAVALMEVGILLNISKYKKI
jgi:cell division protein FtsW